MQGMDARVLVTSILTLVMAAASAALIPGRDGQLQLTQRSR
jgi:hypothetical protein